MSAVAIITARGGSKRIPRKNIKPFCGEPIIAYSIRAALESGLFEDVIVSTDDEEIAAIARRYGASVPFMRSAETSDDFAGTDDVIAEVLLQLQSEGREYEEICCLYPTAPFATSRKLLESYCAMEASGASSVMPVVEFDFPPQRGCVIDAGMLHLVDEQAYLMRSQDLEKIYHDCGQFYWCKTAAFLGNRSLLQEDTIPYIVPSREVQDIDTQDDWCIAELKYRAMTASPA